MLKASKEFAQGIEKLITQVQRDEAVAVAKKTKSKFTAKVPAFRFAKGRHVKRYSMESK